MQDFASHDEQAAFAEVVRRPLNLVYATARRKVQDEGAAQGIAQNVFTALARKAWLFARDDSLSAWLYKTALLESNGCVAKCVGGEGNKPPQDLALL